jgi:hypothetical protein
MTKKTNEGGVDGVSGERVRIVRLEIRDFLGIESADVAVPPAGIFVAGASGAGKSSFLKAVSASLLGEACKPEMIRLNRDGSKLHVEVSDGLTITRTLSRLRQQVATLSVKGADGKTVGKAQQAINERFGSSGWDVISFAAAKPKERLELLAAAMPCPVTVEWLRRWVPRLPDTFDVSGHGLAVIDRLASPGGRLYEQRTIAGRDAETAQTQAKMLVEKARALRAIASDDAATVADADRALADRVRAHERLVEARDVAIAHETKIASTREQIASARERAAAIRADMEDDQKLSVESHSAEQQVVASTRLVERLEAELASARVSLERMRAHAKSVSDRVARSMEQVDSIHALEDQAKALESALTAAAPPGASDEQIAAAASAVSAAEAGLASARTLAETLAAEDDARDALARQ